MVISADMLFHEHAFNINVIYQYFTTVAGSVACYYTMRDSEPTAARGIMVLDRDTHRVTDFYEKQPDRTFYNLYKLRITPIDPLMPDPATSRCASVVFYCIKAATVPLIEQYIAVDAC